MAKFLVDLYLDGYETEEEMRKGMKEWIYDQLNFAGSGVNIKELTEDEEEAVLEILEAFES